MVRVISRLAVLAQTKVYLLWKSTWFVAVALLEDETGNARLNLWRWQIEQERVGDTIRIKNGFVRSFKNQLEANVGSKGRIILISRSH